MAKKSTSKSAPRKSSRTPKQEPQKVNVGELPRRRRADAPVLWVDAMHLQVRSEQPLATLSFEAVINTNTDEAHLLEVVRLQTTVEHVTRMLDVLARNLNHYPKPPVVPK